MKQKGRRVPQINSSYGHMDTRAALVLLLIPIAFLSLSTVFILFGMASITSSRSLRKGVRVLRFPYLMILATPILLTISSAKMTAEARQITGTTEVAPGLWINAWMDSGVYATMWSATAVMWVACGIDIAAAVTFARGLRLDSITVLRR